jgi:cyclopropane fatty-acyl-phospholipid synthase-like methyltransferase
MSEYGYGEYLRSAEWGRDKPTVQVEKLVYLLKAKNSNAPPCVLDAGAGFGRNSVYLAESGFQVTAVEINEEAISSLRENLKAKGVDDRVEIIHESTRSALQACEPDSLDAIVDSGMSHYLNDNEISEYAAQVARTLKPGGLLTLLHFSENEPSATSLQKRNKDSLQDLFPLKDNDSGEGAFEIVDEWREVEWTDERTGNQHKAWQVILRKYDDTHSVEDLRQRAIGLYTEDTGSVDSD